MDCWEISRDVLRKYQTRDSDFREFFNMNGKEWYGDTRDIKKNILDLVLNYACSNTLWLTQQGWLYYFCSLISNYGFSPNMEIFTSKTSMHNVRHTIISDTIVQAVRKFWLQKGMMFSFSDAEENYFPINPFFEALMEVGIQENMEFQMDYIEMSGDQFKFIVGILRKTGFKKWLKLRFRGCSIDDEWMKCFTDALEENGLEEGIALDFSENNIGSDWMNYFIEALARMWLKKWVSLNFSKLYWEVNDKIESNWGVKFIEMLGNVGLEEWVFIRIQGYHLKWTGYALLNFLQTKLLKKDVLLELNCPDSDSLVPAMYAAIKSQWFSPDHMLRYNLEGD